MTILAWKKDWIRCSAVYSYFCKSICKILPILFCKLRPLCHCSTLHKVCYIFLLFFLLQKWWQSTYWPKSFSTRDSKVLKDKLMESTVGSLFWPSKVRFRAGGTRGVNRFFLAIKPSPSNDLTPRYVLLPLPWGLILLLMPGLPLQIFEPSAASAVCKRMPNKLIFLNTKGQEKSEGNYGVLKYSIFW